MENIIIEKRKYLRQEKIEFAIEIFAKRFNINCGTSKSIKARSS